MDKVTKYQCFRCDGEGQIAIMSHEPANEAQEKQPINMWRKLVPHRYPCGSCKDGLVDRDTLKEQIVKDKDFGKNNLELIELFEERTGD